MGMRPLTMARCLSADVCCPVADIQLGPLGPNGPITPYSGLAADLATWVPTGPCGVPKDKGSATTIVATRNRIMRGQKEFPVWRNVFAAADIISGSTCSYAKLPALPQIQSKPNASWDSMPFTAAHDHGGLDGPALASAAVWALLCCRPPRDLSLIVTLFQQ